ncbi:ubiquitin-like modifier-activating enzyme 7 isoform X5 [Vidua macroura]|uniref:ubiquitin-like modifier-activating enzyme 7 isoform X5 n=1 Tax=Vidua macroura TaxID=187451 RepID=UPI0023A7C8F0|nr:ubiquitin-like modifier-activating enzyme 7 isoform X5 [Vidua macroura]
MAGSEEEPRYSRQLYVLGGGARRLPGSAVLVSGLRGTGVQVATALVLAGTGRVVLHDCGAACSADRAHQFLLGESDLGQNRAKASQQALAELNPRVVVEAHTGELSEAFLASFQVVVLTESPLEEQLRVGDFCHAQGICFIVADTKGLAGQLFCDFGERFVVDDPAEGDPVSAAVKHISQGSPGVVTYMGTENSHGHLFHDGDLVTFSGVQGMTELNNQEPIPVHVLDAFRLEISDTSSFSPYRCGGLISQVQQPQECSHKPLCQALEEPKIQVASPEDLPRSCSLHAAFQALHAFRREQGRLPRPRAPADAERVLELARSLGAQQGPLDEDIVRAFASVSAGDLCPVAAVVGALAAQEVLKEPKSVVAAAAVQRMNPDVRVTAHQNQVGPATEILYKDNFFRHLDGVASALDTIEARTYLERRCLRCRTPLLDSGTEGTLGNVLAMVPSLTKLLGPASTPRDGTFPLCTLRHFPRTIQHTLQWAREEFEGLFQLPAEQVNKLMEDPAFLEQQPPGKVLEQVWDSLRERPQDWRDCVRWARRRWQSCYHDAITQLLHIYPPEHETSPGVPFWAGDRSCPHPLTFNPDNDTHLDYVLAAAHLFAQVHRVPPCRDRGAIKAVLRDVVLPPFAPQEGLQIPLTEEPTEEAQVPKDHRQLTELTQDLVQWRQELVGDEDTHAPLMEPIHFEKDNDVHIDFITAASNLRAENYGISPANWLTSKRIAGRIVPAIITTTAAVAGLACLEVYKLVWGCQDLSCYRNSNISLSACLLLRVQPPPAPTYRYGGREWSCWDRLEMRAVGTDGQAMTVQEVLDWLQRTYGWTVTMLLCGDIVLYDSKADAETRARQQAQRLSKSLEDARMPQQQDLELLYMCEGEDAEAEDTRPPLLCSLP